MDLTQFERIPVFAEYFNGADHVDVKSIRGPLSLQKLNIIRPFHRPLVVASIKGTVRTAGSAG